jgi:hypothetical protein
MHAFNQREPIKPTLQGKQLTTEQLKELLAKVNAIADPSRDWLNLHKIRASLIKSNPVISDIEIAMIADMEKLELNWKNTRDGYLNGYRRDDGMVHTQSRTGNPKVRIAAGGHEGYSGEKPTYDGSDYKGKDDKPRGGVWRKLNDEFKPLLHLIATASTVQILPTAALTLDPNQPLLDTFSQLAPNASAWVLAGLDEGVPPNVRQNLTYLREDLLDEYKQKPKASQEAYKLAHQLCSTMINALDERDQTLVRAGFRAVQADAGISGTNQALQARRNYMMSWPQYAREQAQRAELIRQGTAGAQVGKALPKVEWSTRTAALRKTLDGLYAQFREALRQSPAAR